MGVDGRPGEKPQDNQVQAGNADLQAAIAAAQAFNGTIQGAIQLVVQKIDEATIIINNAQTKAIRSVQHERDQSIHAMNGTRSQAIASINSARDAAVAAVRAATPASPGRSAAQESDHRNIENRHKPK
ncbi:MAG: hypothetical protein LCI00_19270 [Chloroflexi bacterium]|nr:hypothetical protein [Chloroflexota bacterium]MCC6894136.1 hypothetical protein [Anaerolineae bacterium]